MEIRISTIAKGFILCLMLASVFYYAGLMPSITAAAPANLPLMNYQIR